MSQISIPGQAFRSAFKRIDMVAIRLPLFLSFLNQLVASGGNFLVGVYLARTLPLEGFGLYGIGFGICMLYVGVGNALILTQMVVNMADKDQADKEDYAGRMLCAVLALGALLLVLTAVLGLALPLIKPETARWFKPMIAIAIASALFLCNEYFISYAFLKRKEGLALAVNASMIFVLISGLAIERAAGIVPSANHAFLLYGLGAAVGSAYGYLVSRLSIRRILRSLSQLIPDYVESWRHGRWALGGVIVTWIQSQAYTYIVAFSLGPAGVGLANAARIFISPMTFLVPAINKVAIPRLTDLRQNNPEKMRFLSTALTAAMTGLATLYSLALLTCVEFASQHILGRHDPRVASLVWIWCLVLILQMIRSGGGVLMQVRRKFRTLALLNLPSVAITLLATAVLIRMFGVAGAIFGMAIGELVLSALIWREIRYDSNDS